MLAHQHLGNRLSLPRTVPVRRSAGSWLLQDNAWVCMPYPFCDTTTQCGLDVLYMTPISSQQLASVFADYPTLKDESSGH